MKPSLKPFILALTLFTAVLLPVSAFAGGEPGCLKLKELQSGYDGVATGMTMFLHLKFNTHDCRLPVDSLPTISVAPDTSSEFSVTVGFPDYSKVKKSDTSPGVGAASELELPVFVKPGEVAPGKYEITAVLHYDAIGKNGNRIQQSTPVTIPVRVVRSQADVHATPITRRDSWKPFKIAGMVAAAIVATPVLFALGIVQLVTGIEILPSC
jgi:hypothetical protein